MIKNLWLNPKRTLSNQIPKLKKKGELCQRGTKNTCLLLEHVDNLFFIHSFLQLSKTKALMAFLCSALCVVFCRLAAGWSMDL